VKKVKTTKKPTYAWGKFWRRGFECCGGQLRFVSKKASQGY
jgi:hypothetical protein